jgi:hypothetical protein
MTTADELRSAAKTLRTPHADAHDCVALLDRFLDAREPLAVLLDRIAEMSEISRNNGHIGAEQVPLARDVARALNRKPS